MYLLFWRFLAHGISPFVAVFIITTHTSDQHSYGRHEGSRTCRRRQRDYWSNFDDFITVLYAPTLRLVSSFVIMTTRSVAFTEAHSILLSWWWFLEQTDWWLSGRGFKPVILLHLHGPVVSGMRKIYSLPKIYRRAWHPRMAGTDMRFNYQGPMTRAHQISPNISLTVLGIETKQKKVSHQSSITECIEFYQLAFVQGAPPLGPLGTTALFIWIEYNRPLNHQWWFICSSTLKPSPFRSASGRTQPATRHHP